MELSITLNCYKEKRDALKRGNYRELMSTGLILKIIERAIKILREQAGIDEM